MLNFSVAQQILIVAGAAFQIGAFYIFFKECGQARLVEESKRKSERELAKAEAIAQAVVCDKAARDLVKKNVFPKVVKYRRHIEGVMEHVPDDIRPADMARTAKVHFKHSLEAYQGETQALAPLHR